jgi:hypothetical protein
LAGHGTGGTHYPNGHGSRVTRGGRPLGSADLEGGIACLGGMEIPPGPQIVLSAFAIDHAVA